MARSYRYFGKFQYSNNKKTPSLGGVKGLCTLNRISQCGVKFLIFLTHIINFFKLKFKHILEWKHWFQTEQPKHLVCRVLSKHFVLP